MVRKRGNKKQPVQNQLTAVQPTREQSVTTTPASSTNRPKADDYAHISPRRPPHQANNFMSQSSQDFINNSYENRQGPPYYQSKDHRSYDKRKNWTSQEANNGRSQPNQAESSSKNSGQVLYRRREYGAPDKVQARSISRKAETAKSEEFQALPYSKNIPGKCGFKKITVLSNHFALSLGQLSRAYQYDVDIKENGKSDGQHDKATSQGYRGKKVNRSTKIKDLTKRTVMRTFLEKYFPGRYPAFDGSQTLYSSKPLGDERELLDVDVQVLDDLNKLKSFRIQLKLVKELDITPQPASSASPELFPRDVHQFIEVVLRNAPVHIFTQISRGFFRKPDDRVIEIGRGMEMYYGFSQSVVLGGRWEKIKPLLNLHLSHKAFAKNIPVVEAFLEIINKDRIEDLSELNAWQSKSINDYVKALKVSYQVPPNGPKVVYRVNGLGKTPHEQKLEVGKPDTIFDYYKKEKKYEIKYPKIPLLWVGSKQRSIYVPPELCVIEKDQSIKKKLGDFQTKKMIIESATDTKVRRQKTMDRLHEAEFLESPYLKEFGFSVSDKFEQTEARILEPPKIQYANDQTSEVRKGAWQGQVFYDAKIINKWAIVNLETKIRQNHLKKLDEELRNASSAFGIKFLTAPDYRTVTTQSRYGPTLKNFEMFFNESIKNTSYDVIVIVLPFNNANEVYSNVKYAAEVSVGCLTQCIKPKTVECINRKTAENILLKLNAKLNGTNHVLSHHTKPLALQKNETVMIIGADVTHPSPQSDLPCSIAAIVASHDPTGLFQHNWTIRLQEKRTEYILDMKNVVKEQLLYFFRKNNGIKPEKIFYFRDGVSDGEFAKVRAIELKAIMDACKEVQNDGYVPKIAFIVVQKRHHTRIFPLNDKDSEDQGFRQKPGNFNVPAGTCVDTNIVDPGIQNFYLLSHGSIKGVSRPTKYTTLYDDMDLSNDEIQQLAYYLCHMFARCTRSVSYPAPTYYAHLGALRGKAYVNALMAQNQFDDTNLEAQMEKIQIKLNIKDNNPMFCT